jgi:hypothetical protein
LATYNTELLDRDGLEARFDELIEQEMLAHGLNPDHPRDLNIYLRAKLAELKSREH